MFQKNSNKELSLIWSPAKFFLGINLERNIYSTSLNKNWGNANHPLFIDKGKHNGIIVKLILEKKVLIFVDKLPKEGLEISKDFEYSSSGLLDESALFLQLVHAEMNIKKVGENILIKGKIETCLSFTCSRCLMPFRFFVDSKFDLVYLPEELDSIKEELNETDMNNFFYHNHQIDIREIVLEQLNLTFPVKPLCSEGCQGICPVCGKTRRYGKCDCVVEDSDPRLQKFKEFIKDRQ